MCALTNALRRDPGGEDDDDDGDDEESGSRAFGLEGRRPRRPFRLSVRTTEMTHMYKKGDFDKHIWNFNHSLLNQV